jgi:hypothetical protein
MADLPTRSDFQDYAVWAGREVHASDGGPLGRVDAIFLDEATDAPEWVLVGLHDDGGAAFVPLAGATVEASAIRVDHDRVRRPAPAEASSSSQLPRLALPAFLGAAIAALIGLLVLRRRRS